LFFLRSGLLFELRYHRVEEMQQGLIVNHKKIKRLMREYGLRRRSADALSQRQTAITTRRSFPIERKI
jgi:hypothetical protein